MKDHQPTQAEKYMQAMKLFNSAFWKLVAKKRKKKKKPKRLPPMRKKK